MPDERHTFETARIRLEEIAAEVRKKDTSLEKSLDLLEEGVRLANICTELVDHTDLSAAVAQTVPEPAGEPVDDDEPEFEEAGAPTDTDEPAAHDGDDMDVGPGNETAADQTEPPDFDAADDDLHEPGEPRETV
jgi:exodeoxyribonuclease VII small subunit